MTRNPDAICGTCPYWEGWPEDVDEEDWPTYIGTCKRRPFADNSDDNWTNSAWVAVNYSNWCGEHPDFEKKHDTE